jgi:hypothetical protein
VTIGFREPGTPDTGNRCATTVQRFYSAGSAGTLRFP